MHDLALWMKEQLDRRLVVGGQVVSALGRCAGAGPPELGSAQDVWHYRGYADAAPVVEMVRDIPSNGRVQALAPNLDSAACHTQCFAALAIMAVMGMMPLVLLVVGDFIATIDNAVALLAKSGLKDRARAIQPTTC